MLIELRLNLTVFWQALTNEVKLCFWLQVKLDFFDLLSDHHVDVSQRWSKVKDKLETDQRYKAVESSAAREELYKQYVEKQAKVRTVSLVLLIHQDETPRRLGLRLEKRIEYKCLCVV